MHDEIKIRKDKADEWRWTYVSANGEKMGDSGEGYKNRQDCIAAVMRVCGLDTISLDREIHLASEDGVRRQTGAFSRDTERVSLEIIG